MISLLLKCQAGGVPRASSWGADPAARASCPSTVLRGPLCLGSHHDIRSGDGLADDAELVQPGGSSTGDLRYTQVEQLSLELLELLGQILLVLGPLFQAFHITTLLAVEIHSLLQKDTSVEKTVISQYFTI